MNTGVDTRSLERRCMECGRLIHESFGCVDADSFNRYNEAMKKGKSPEGIWERCAQCVEATLLSEDFS